MVNSPLETFMYIHSKLFLSSLSFFVLFFLFFNILYIGSILLERILETDNLVQKKTLGKIILYLFAWRYLVSIIPSWLHMHHPWISQNWFKQKFTMIMIAILVIYFFVFFKSKRNKKEKNFYN